MAKPTDPDALAKKAERAARLGELKNHPSWLELADMARSRKERFTSALLRELLAGVAADQRRIDYLRGFWDGVETLLQYPDLAETQLESALKRAQLSEGD